MTVSVEMAVLDSSAQWSHFWNAIWTHIHSDVVFYEKSVLFWNMFFLPGLGMCMHVLVCFMSLSVENSTLAFHWVQPRLATFATLHILEHHLSISPKKSSTLPKKNQIITIGFILSCCVVFFSRPFRIGQMVELFLQMMINWSPSSMAPTSSGVAAKRTGISSSGCRVGWKWESEENQEIQYDQETEFLEFGFFLFFPDKCRDV